MRSILIGFFLSLSIFCQGQIVQDDFEGSGNITTWFGDDCGLNTSLVNPLQQGINNSSTVLEYNDIGGQYANVRFDVATNFDLTAYNSFTLKIYVPTNGLTGSQTNQISLKLQDGTLGSPWLTQSEIIKSVVLDQWQEVTFDFENDTYINFDDNSPPPISRTDFNRVVIQINGENNTDHVLGYLDDIIQEELVSTDPVFDNLVWSDEFDGSGAISSTNWHHQTQLPNGSSWYNSEIQHYTNRTDNSYVSGGTLKILAKKETFSDQGQTKDYTSARLNSKFTFTNGRIEVRAKLPFGVGTWPAIWTLGKNINEDGGYWDIQGFGTTGWPACGEIDIMEHWGTNQNFIQSAMHTPSSSGNTMNKGGQTISTASTAFHVYSLDWFEDKMVFKVDGVEHYTYEPVTINSSTWPFEDDQYILFNVAILPSTIGTGFTESAMEIDYVRVYQESALSVSDLNKNDIKIFPNPVADTLNIDLPSELKGSKATIYSISGQKVTSFIQKETSFILDVSNYKAGIYFIRFDKEGKVTTFKILKK